MSDSDSAISDTDSSMSDLDSDSASDPSEPAQAPIHDSLAGAVDTRREETGPPSGASAPSTGRALGRRIRVIRLARAT